jgi:hypothetical protein
VASPCAAALVVDRYAWSSAERAGDKFKAPVCFRLRLGIARQVAHLGAEHQAEDFRIIERKADIGLAQRTVLVGARIAGEADGAHHVIVQPVEAVAREFGKDRLAVGEVVIRCLMADTGAAGDLAHRERA